MRAYSKGNEGRGGTAEERKSLLIRKGIKKMEGIGKGLLLKGGRKGERATFKGDERGNE